MLLVPWYIHILVHSPLALLCEHKSAAGTLAYPAGCSPPLAGAQYDLTIPTMLHGGVVNHLHP